MKKLTVKGKAYFITDHAAERMQERRIGLGHIRRALKTKAYFNGKLNEYTLRVPRLRVHVDQDVVVTMYVETFDRRDKLEMRRGHRRKKHKARYGKRVQVF